MRTIDGVEVRGLTVRQPWCSALVDGHKPVENRSQGFTMGFRGLVLLHAAKEPAVAGYRDPRIQAVYPSGSSFDMGCVIGVAELVEAHPASGCCAPWGEETYEPSNPEMRPPGRVTHLRFDRPVRLHEPVVARGALGLWNPDVDLLLEVCHRLADVVTWDSEAARGLADQGALGQLHAVTALSGDCSIDCLDACAYPGQFSECGGGEASRG